MQLATLTRLLDCSGSDHLRPSTEHHVKLRDRQEYLPFRCRKQEWAIVFTITFRSIPERHAVSYQRSGCREMRNQRVSSSDCDSQPEGPLKA